MQTIHLVEMKYNCPLLSLSLTNGNWLWNADQASSTHSNEYLSSRLNLLFLHSVARSKIRSLSMHTLTVGSRRVTRHRFAVFMSLDMFHGIYKASRRFPSTTLFQSYRSRTRLTSTFVSRDWSRVSYYHISERYASGCYCRLKVGIFADVPGRHIQPIKPRGGILVNLFSMFGNNAASVYRTLVIESWPTSVRRLFLPLAEVKGFLDSRCTVCRSRVDTSKVLRIGDSHTRPPLNSNFPLVH